MFTKGEKDRKWGNESMNVGDWDWESERERERRKINYLYTYTFDTLKS